jgi:hypothetical protein
MSRPRGSVERAGEAGIVRVQSVGAATNDACRWQAHWLRKVSASIPKAREELCETCSVEVDLDGVGAGDWRRRHQRSAHPNDSGHAASPVDRQTHGGPHRESTARRTGCSRRSRTIWRFWTLCGFLERLTRPTSRRPWPAVSQGAQRLKESRCVSRLVGAVVGALGAWGLGRKLSGGVATSASARTQPVH